MWIDSQTEEEILRGIREAKDEAEYDNLSASAYLRAKEDYLMGINFSRALTLKFGPAMGAYLGETRRPVLSAGRVMTCVLGMAVRREREIREFVKTPFLPGDRHLSGGEAEGEEVQQRAAGGLWPGGDCFPAGDSRPREDCFPVGGTRPGGRGSGSHPGGVAGCGGLPVF